MTGRKTLAEVKKELEAALAGKSLPSSPVIDALKRVLEAGPRQSVSHPVEERPAEPDNSAPRDHAVGH